MPRSLREPIGLAYLLARAADTIADTRLIPRDDRLGHLEILRQAGAGELVDVRALARACAPVQTHAAERRLLERVGEALARIEALAPADRHEVRAVLATLTSGMIFDLTRFPGEDTEGTRGDRDARGASTTTCIWLPAASGPSGRRCTSRTGPGSATGRCVR